VTCGFSVSGSVPIFTDQAVENGSSADPLGVRGRLRRSGERGVVVGDALRDALVQPGRVVVHLVFGQDAAQVCLAQDQHPVE
jgi:hypothetical protein